MTKYLSAVVLFGGIAWSSAFSIAPRMAAPLFGPLFAETKSPEVITYFEDLEKAVDCASTFGKCSVPLLRELADKVDAGSDSCMWEVSQELCQKEIDDRKDVADILRLQAELVLRMEYLDRANLFADDVRAEHDIRQRDDEMELLSEDAM